LSKIEKHCCEAEKYYYTSVSKKINGTLKPTCPDKECLHEWI